MFALAEHLHITVGDVLTMSQAEFVGWIAYLNLKAEKEKTSGHKRTTNNRRS